MAAPAPWRWVAEADIEAYAAYRHALAAGARPGDPPPHCFGAWFQARYHAAPLDELFAADPTHPAALACVGRPAVAQPAPHAPAGA